jgi:hypothetical protein
MPRRGDSRSRFRLPRLRMPAFRVDFMTVIIVLMVGVNLALIAFGVRQCGSSGNGPAVPGEAGRPDSSKTAVPAPVPAVQIGEEIKAPVQIEVLNGCGATGIADKFTAFLRQKGFDVVKTGNYESFNVPRTLVIDRKGNVRLAVRIGAALGLKKSEVISEIHDLYMVDATVVLGKDFRLLSSWKSLEKKSAKK